MKNATLKPSFKPKTMLKLILTFTLLVIISLPSAQAAMKKNEPEKVVHKKIELSERPEVSLTTYNEDVQILPSKGNYIEVSIKYLAESKESESLKILEQKMTENLISQSGNKVNISMKPYKSYNQFVMLAWNYIKMEFKDGSNIELTKYKVLEFTVHLPEDMDLNIDARYGKLYHKSDIKGNLELKNYDADYYGQKVTGDVNIDARYSQIDFSTCENGNVKLYESKLNGSFKNNLKLDSRYSKIKTLGSGTLTYKGYEDELRSGVNGTVSLNARYCEIEFMTADEIDADMYEGSLTVVNLKNKLKLNSRYLKGNIINANEILMDSCYETDLTLTEVNTVKSKRGKYNEYKINELKNSIDIDGYEEDIDIEKVSDDFQQIFVDGKYIDLKMNISDKVDYKLNGKVKYPDFNFDKDDFDVAMHDKESSSIAFEYYKGSRSTTREIKIMGYEVDVKLNE